MTAGRAEINLPELDETRRAFDSVAADYDGPRGNNELIQDMRAEMWRWLDATFVPGSHLMDIGCGTGLDALRMARCGYHITATDWSPEMVRRTEERTKREGGMVRTMTMGAHELHRLNGEAMYDGAYSNLGPLNCVPDLTAFSREIARLLKPGGALVFTVIGRVCPWEFIHHARRGRWARARIRQSSGFVPVGMNGQTIWARYYSPGDFYRHFQQEFALSCCRGICVLVPPPYLSGFRDRNPRLYRWLWRLDRRVSAWPGLRAMGDHFLMVMKKR